MSVTLLIVDPWQSCMLFTMRCNPVHPLNGVLPGPYVPVWVTCGAWAAHQYTYALPCCRTSQYSRTFFPLSVSLWNDLANSVFDSVGLVGFKSRANDFFIGLSCSIPTIVFYSFSLSLLLVYRLVLWGWGLRTDRCISLSRPALPTCFNSYYYYFNTRSNINDKKYENLNVVKLMIKF